MCWAGPAKEIESTCEETAPEGAGEEQAHEPPSVGLSHSMQARLSSSLQAGSVFQCAAAAASGLWELPPQ